MQLSGLARKQSAPKGFVAYDGEGWVEIDPSLLETGRGDIPVFPVHVLPTTWAQWASDAAESTGAPIDYVAQGLLASVAAVSGAGIEAEVNLGWREPLVLWSALVGVSPCAARRLIEPIEQEMRARDGERQREHDTNVEQARVLEDKWEGECEAALERGAPAPLKPAEAAFGEDFVPSQIVVADATIEALVDVVAGNPRGVVLWRDELAAWLGNLGRYSNGSDRPQYLEAWAAASVTINRKSRRGPLHIGRFPVSIVGSIQPDRITEALQGADDGMAARFLYVWPAPPKYRSILTCRTADNGTAQERLKKIASIAGTAEHPRILQLSGEAQALLDVFLSDLHVEALNNDGLEAGFLGKGRGTVVRLAAALALLRWSEAESVHGPDVIDLDSMRDAAGLWADYFRSHARAVFSQAGATGRDRHLRKTIRWLRTSRIEELSREDVRCTALGRAVDAEGADRIIARLVAGQVLRQVKSGSWGGRGRPALRWSVNPALFQTGDTDA